MIGRQGLEGTIRKPQSFENILAGAGSKYKLTTVKTMMALQKVSFTSHGDFLRTTGGKLKSNFNMLKVVHQIINTEKKLNFI